MREYRGITPQNLARRSTEGEFTRLQHDNKKETKERKKIVNVTNNARKNLEQIRPDELTGRRTKNEPHHLQPLEGYVPVDEVKEIGGHSSEQRIGLEKAKQIEQGYTQDPSDKRNRGQKPISTNIDRTSIRKKNQFIN